MFVEDNKAGINGISLFPQNNVMSIGMAARSAIGFIDRNLMVFTQIVRSIKTGNTTADNRYLHC